MPSASTGKFWAPRGASGAQLCAHAESSMHRAPCPYTFFLGQHRVLLNYLGQNEAHGKSYNWGKMSPNTQTPAPRLNWGSVPRGAGGWWSMGIPEELGPKDIRQVVLRKTWRASRSGRKSMLSRNKWKVKEALGFKLSIQQFKSRPEVGYRKWAGGKKLIHYQRIYYQ